MNQKRLRLSNHLSNTCLFLFAYLFLPLWRQYTFSSASCILIEILLLYVFRTTIILQPKLQHAREAVHYLCKSIFFNRLTDSLMLVLKNNNKLHI